MAAAADALPVLSPKPYPAFVAATTYRRLELKYWATELQAAALLRLTKPHLELDPYCLEGAQRNVSLYLDTPGRTFYDATFPATPIGTSSGSRPTTRAPTTGRRFWR